MQFAMFNMEQEYSQIEKKLDKSVTKITFAQKGGEDGLLKLSF